MSGEVNLDALDELLDVERTALLTGDLVKLTEMLPAKEALMNALSGEGQTNLPALIELDGKVRRNQLLLDGALEGIRDVAKRMSALRQMRGALETYGSDGKKHNIDVAADHSVERRA
jgi:flagellar biosynthesis/type III secretory pathway chaperone